VDNLSPAMRKPVLPDDHLAENRVRFLTHESIEPNQVRDTILASWWRSRRWKVAADRIDLPYVRDPNLDLPLTRSAEPIMQKLLEQLGGQPISLILTDPAGVVLSRMTADHDLERHLDRVQLAPGFSYAEEFVGTNGIGTALEGGRAMHVFGHEHYAENLEDLACAGVPIHHPISGKTVGAVDLTCWRRDAGALLVALAKSTADQIQQALLTDSSMRELELFQAYLRACRRTTGMVFALNNDVVMMNDHARHVLDPRDQSVLLEQASEALAGGRRTPVTVDLPTGLHARMHCQPVHGESRVAGGVVHVRLIEQDDHPAAVSGPLLLPLLPGIVGTAALWRRASDAVDRGYRAGEWLALTGERGVGKLVLARAVHQRRNPTGRFHVLSLPTGPGWADQARKELLDPTTDTLVIRNVDQLGAQRVNTLAATLREARADDRGGPSWVVVTLTTGGADADLGELLRFVPSTVEVPPLRHHIEDLRELVPFFLSKLSHGSGLTCSPEAMQLLMRSTWPGNTRQLYEVLKQIVQRRRRSGAIQAGDLPPEYRTVSRRSLSQLEAMERDAVVQSLLDADGNKAQAAKALGMSRATMYRKIHEYGIVTPTN